MKRSLIIIFLILSCTLFSYSQSCTKDKIIGTWIAVKAFTGIRTNIDSLKAIIDTASTSFSSWTFNSDGTYDQKHKYSNYKPKKNTYTFKEQTCEIILPVKRDAFAKDFNNLEIIYVNSNYLIYKSDDNPKGYFTTLAKRKL